MDDSFVTFGSELDCDHFQEKLNLLFTLEEKNHSLNFLDVLVEKEGTRILTSIYWITTFTGQYICSNYFSQKTRKISFIKTSVHRAIMICSRTKLGSEINNIKQLFIENGYPADVLFSCINQKLANFATETTFGTEKSPVYLNCPGYPADVLFSCINQKLANFATETTFGTEKSPVYLNCPGLVALHQSFKIKLIKPLHLVFML